MSASQHTGVRHFVVVGGGTAGYFAALALKRAFAHLDVTLIESSKIPIIGVGEATTTLMPTFLHRQLGIDIGELYREVHPTWKLGIKFEWGLPNGYSFNYPFGPSDPVDAWAHDGHIANQSVMSMMMTADRVPIVTGDDGKPVSLLAHMPFAYHLENRSFVAFLAKQARRAGIEHIDAEIERVETTVDGDSVERLILRDGGALRGDVYIDASGFRALLIEKALASPFISFDSSLFCDAAVVGQLPQNGPIEPYTTAETMDAGWCWRIPVEGEDHRGYVFSSAHLTLDQAQAEMRAKNPGLSDTWSLRFRSGRHREFWKGNTIAVGNAYGFVEPLESTALHMVIIELAQLIAGLRSVINGEHRNRTVVNTRIGAHWDYLRWFLALHYRFNRKKDTEFWRACRETADVSGLQALLDRHRGVGPWGEGASAYRVSSDPTFGSPGLLIMLLGQQVPCPPAPPAAAAKVDWNARVAEDDAVVRRAFRQAEALELLRHRPELLDELVNFSGSWMVLSELGNSGEWRTLQESVRH